MQRTFDLNGKQVRSEDVDFLKSALWSGTVKHNVNVLDLSDNLIGASGVATLFKHVLPHLSNLIELNLSNNPKLGLEGIKALVKSFHDESTLEIKLRTLRLNHCLLGKSPEVVYTVLRPTFRPTYALRSIGRTETVCLLFGQPPP